MSKKTKGESTRSQRLTIESLEQFGGLAGFAPPTGDFDPAGTWSHAFRLWMVSEKGGHSSQDVHYRGLLQITRKPLLEEKAISFEVRQAYLQDIHTPSVHDTQAKLVCADDALASPRRWTLRHTILDAKLAPVPQTEIKQSGEIEGTTMQVSYAGQSVQRQVPERLTCNWSLWDSIQRLPRAKRPPSNLPCWRSWTCSSWVNAWIIAGRSNRPSTARRCRGTVSSTSAADCSLIIITLTNRAACCWRSAANGPTSMIPIHRPYTNSRSH